jgi:succinoglycan biosynthesis protein ExoM
MDVLYYRRHGLYDRMVPSSDLSLLPVVSVCISTLRRPAGLSRLLTAIVEQVEAPPFDVVVVDNDVGGSVAEIVESFRARLRLSYFVEARRGLSNARNRAVSESAGPYIAFIDDDEWPSPHWLANLYRAAATRSADAVFGPVRVLFADNVPDYVRNCSLFNKRPLEDGALVGWPDTYTSNALVRRDALPDSRRPFRERFNLIGGEDCDLFKRMLDKGAVAIAASEAVVFERRSRRRAGFWWALRRAFRDGGTSAELQWGAVQSSARRSFAIATSRPYIAYSVKRLIRSKGDSRFHHLLIVATELGKIACALGFRLEEYRRAGNADEVPE